MNKIVKIVSSTLVASGLLLGTSLANAQDITVRQEPGVAVPLTSPQTNHYQYGGDLAVKLDIGLTPWLDVGPSVGFMDLQSHSPDTVPGGTAWSFGGLARVKRPHDESNHGEGLTAVSPWLDGELDYVRTGDLDRSGWSVGAGAAVPTSADRNLWIGPFARYQGTIQPNTPGYDDRDAKVFIAGVSIEIGVGVKHKKEVVIEKVVEVAPCPPPERIVVPAPDVAPAKLALEETIHFAWDSFKLDANAQTLLDGDTAKILAAPHFKRIVVEGHASSDGQVEHNNVLSQHRAEAVLDYLVSQGVSRNRLVAKSFGSSRPLSDNKTLAGRQNNRRVSFVVRFIMEESN
jgi:outer membrane protein OmpA-like peptidoglycan-associated protein